MTTIDYTATILDLAGVNVPGTMQGLSFLPLLQNKPMEKPWRNEFFYDHSFGANGHLPLIHGVRTDQYKYTRYISQHPPYEELFDLNNPFFPASGPANRSFNGLHPKSKFLALH